MPLSQVEEAIWPEQTNQDRAFHSALYRLRRALRRQGEDTKFILAKGGEYWLDSEQFAVDADRFAEAAARAGTAGGAESIQWYEEALKLYKGHYLSNLLYYDWAAPERQRLQKTYLDVLSRLAALYAEQRQYQQAARLREEVLKEDPYNEACYCDLMRYYALLGDRAGLVRQYRQLESVLQEALKVEPALSTQQLYRSLLQKCNG